MQQTVYSFLSRIIQIETDYMLPALLVIINSNVNKMSLMIRALE